MCLNVTTIRCATDGFKVWSPGVSTPKAFKRAELAGIKEHAEKVHCKSSVARYCLHNRRQTGQERHLHPMAICTPWQSAPHGNLHPMAICTPWQSAPHGNLHPMAISRVTSVCQINRSTCGIDTLLNQLPPVFSPPFPVHSLFF
jgi:hypothetical protein